MELGEVREMSFKGKHHTKKSRQKISEGNKGKHHSEETRRKISESNKGKKQSIESRQKISDGIKIRWQNKEYQQKVSDGMKRIWENDDYKEKMSDAHKGEKNGMYGKHHTEESIRKNSESQKGEKSFMYGKPSPMKGKHRSEETRQKMSISTKRCWQDEEYRERMIKAILNGLFKRPTSLEKQMIDIIEKNNLPYEYTGDGRFLIEYRNPDFVNTQGKKICIEVANTFHHDENYAEERINYFAEYGWKCIVFRTDLLDEKEILQKLEEVK